ncbi:AcrVA2 family anti-CRISPR protein [Leptospira noguchii]|uniref:AcrVA2 family anti-CRISPR protein n=1 Tax=Leptospira noguchii TaxID=28182 RepID=UPI000B1A686F|nr:hypothetical protein [Leptospira noguchii]UOG50900.1 hypothetical protein MAL00_19255 [Leptospira noguchii]
MIYISYIETRNLMQNIKKTLKRKDRKRIKSRPEQLTDELFTLIPHYKDVLKISLELKNEWNQYVFAPLGAYFPILFEGKPKLDPKFLVKMNLLQQMAAIVPWSLSKSIYKFTNELIEELTNSELPENIPCEALKLLPYWSIYIELSNQEIKDCKGFFVFLDSIDGIDELRILMDFEDKPPYLLKLLLKDNCSIEESLKFTTDQIKTKYFGNITNRIFHFLDTSNDLFLEYFKKIIPLILYINSENSEITGNYPYTEYKKRTKEKMEVGISLEPNSNITIWEVGKNFSQSLRLHNRNIKEEIKENSKSPHIRRSHWHHYWVGSGENRRLTLQWLSPIFINPQ